MKKNNKVNCRGVPMTGGIIAGPSDPLWEEDCILPVQFFADLRENISKRPEALLMLAVLEDAIHNLTKYANAKGEGQELFEETKQWLEDNDARWFYSICNICNVFNVDVVALRNDVSRMIKKGKSVRVRRMRFRNRKMNDSITCLSVY